MKSGDPADLDLDEWELEDLDHEESDEPSVEEK